MKLNILQIICLINYVGTFPIFDELWEKNQSEPQPNNNPIESQPKIKVEPHEEEQFNGKWRDESALKGIVKVEQEPHYGAVKVEGKDKIKHEFKWWDEESDEFKEQLEDRVKEEDQDGQAPNTSDHKNNGDDDENCSEDEDNSAPSEDNLDQHNFKEVKHLSDQNNSTDQDESFDEQKNESNEYQKIYSDQHKLKIIQKFREMKEDYKKNRKYSSYQHKQIDRKISNGLGVNRTTLYKWKKEFGFSVSNKKFSEFEKREILKQFDEIKNKCKKAKLKNISMNELDKKIAKKLGVSASTITEWKRKFGLSVINKKFSDETKIEILKKYAKIKGKNPKMRDLDIADLLKISINSLKKWKAHFKKNKNL